MHSVVFDIRFRFSVWNNAVLEDAFSCIRYSIPDQRLKQRLSSKKHSVLPISKFRISVWNNDCPRRSIHYYPNQNSSFRRQRLIVQRCPRRSIQSYPNQNFGVNVWYNVALEEAFSLIKIRSLHQSVNHFQYQINQPRQSFKTTLFPRSQKFTSIRQSLPISNQSAETVVRNNAVPKKSKFLHQSINHFQYQTNQPRQSFETTLCSNRSNNQQ